MDGIATPESAAMFPSVLQKAQCSGTDGNEQRQAGHVKEANMNVRDSELAGTMRGGGGCKVPWCW